MDRHRPRRKRTFQPRPEAVEGRLLLSAAAAPGLNPRGLLLNPKGYHAVRPNTPVLPFGAPLSTATFLDPSACIFNGDNVIVGAKSFVGPYATLDATGGYIKIGDGSAVLDNARVAASARAPGAPGPASSSIVFLGERVQVGFGATVLGPSRIGSYSVFAKPTGIGANALVDRAVVEPGAVVGELARVGPGVTVPTGMYVLPGASVSTNAEASDPALGKVVPLPVTVRQALETELTRDAQLAAGYTTLYQGNAATGVNPGVDPYTSPNIYNGNLAAVRGASQQPGPTSSTAPTGITFEPARSGPSFPGPHRPRVEGLLPNFPARITGDARNAARANVVARDLGRRNSVRADQGQPISFAGPARTGRAVTINAPLGGTVTTGGTTKLTGLLTIGAGLVAQDGAVLLGGPAAEYVVGQDVTIGTQAVVARSSIGAGASIGARSVVLDSTLAPGQVVPPGTVLIGNTVVGQVQW